jgi:hypothetical protein
MQKWLGLLVLLPLAAASAGHAQDKGIATADVASVARSHQIDLRLSQQQGNERPLPLIRGLIVQRDVAPNAIVGLGLANMYGRRKSGASARPGDLPISSRKPAVTFVMKF